MPGLPVILWFLLVGPPPVPRDSGECAGGAVLAAMTPARFELASTDVDPRDLSVSDHRSKDRMRTRAVSPRHDSRELSAQRRALYTFANPAIVVFVVETFGG
jgi:hypothetical protein